MPITFFHHPLAYLIFKIDKRLSLPGLIVGCMFPDLEIAFMFLMFGTQISNRMVLHSLLGSATIGTFFAIIVTVKIYPYIVSSLFHLEKKKIENRCKLSLVLVFSVLLGNFSHVLLDVTNHPYNPVFWPFLPSLSTPSPIYFVLGDPLGSLWMQIIMGVLLLGLILIKRKNLFEELLVG